MKFRSLGLGFCFRGKQGASILSCLVLSREWGNGLWGLLLGDSIGTTIGIHSPIPY